MQTCDLHEHTCLCMDHCSFQELVLRPHMNHKSRHTCHQEYIDTFSWNCDSSHQKLRRLFFSWFLLYGYFQYVLPSFFSWFPQCVPSHTCNASYRILLCSFFVWSLLYRSFQYLLR
ncbi:hypothetical protein FR483_n382L [Paramecium bursaria Chlorella virus FR483]|uniref:Uncharacterized protein n382L n=1 Tax=Paramecium bursaria Chlorella virus FR483 TaxID=399781 RepID=A7J786_PBCVF|nr:hypothetical protein FR483_n382L [Paramecium bursaria Chlorella virus FR483]ABT15667.1 hypothetical protein FR483_n382L [Paramecium bursaria Chlorella virus FR483]